MNTKATNKRLWWIRSKKSILFVLGAIFLSVNAFSQGMLVVDDRANLLNPGTELLVSESLRQDSIELTSVVDYKQRCLYYFTEFSVVGGEAFVTIRNCVDDVLGRKNLGTRILSSDDQEKSLLLTYALLDIIAEPGKHIAVDRSNIAVQANQDNGGTFQGSALNDEHKSRYFFAPSAFNLKKGVLYYNTVYFLLHDIQYGVEDWFSIGMGTTIIGLPFYLTPKFSIPVGEKSAVAIGDMLLFGTYGTNAIGNLAYTSFSTGGPNGTVSIGLGHLATNESDITRKTSSLVLNFSAMAKASPYIYLLTENYLFNVNLSRTAYQDNYDPVTDYYDYRYEEYTQRNSLWYGIVGFRINSKNKDFTSWQVGLTYVLSMPGEIPRAYSNWETYAPTRTNLIAFPTISYTRKFSKRY